MKRIKPPTVRRIKSGLLASMMCVTAMPALDFSAIQTNAYEFRDSYTIYGDLNHDGIVDSFDIVLMRKEVEKGEYVKSLDFNCDNAVDAEDLKILNDYVLGAVSLIDAYLYDDADEDKICDLYEVAILNSDPDSSDTDGDSLSDLEELVLTQTSLTESNTDNSSKSDAEDDPDEDNLTNKEELIAGTDPLSADTDRDGLNDYDELNVYGTNPLLADSDDDGLDDSSELKFELDPNDPVSSGETDGQFVISQDIKPDNKILSSVNTDDNPYVLSIDINTAGDAEKFINVYESSFSSVIENEAMIGESIDVCIGDGHTPEKTILNFDIKDGYTENSLNKFSSLEEFKGIKRLNVFRFDTEEGMLLPVDTEFDIENNRVYSAVDKAGTYCLMDMEVWLDNLGVELPEEVSDDTSDTSQMLMTADTASITSNGVPKQYEFNGHKYARIDSMGLTWAEAKKYCESMGGHLMTVNSEKEEEFLEKTLISRGNQNVYWLGGYNDNGTWEWVTNETFSYTKWCSGQPDNYYNVENRLSIYRKDNPGMWISSAYYWNDLNNSGTVTNQSFFGLGTTGFICEWEPDNTVFTILLPTNWKTITLKAPLVPYGKTDSDSDSLTDWEEVDQEKVTVKSDGTFELPELRFADIISRINRFKQNDTDKFLTQDLTSKPYLPVISDPTDPDTDNDGVPDHADDEPLINTSAFNCIIYYEKPHTKENWEESSLSNAAYDITSQLYDGERCVYYCVSKNKEFQDVWNNRLPSSMRTIHMYLHGGANNLYFDNEAIEADSINNGTMYFESKAVNYKVYLFACKGAKTIDFDSPYEHTHMSAARAFAKLCTPTPVIATEDSVDYFRAQLYDPGIIKSFTTPVDLSGLGTIILYSIAKNYEKYDDVYYPYTHHRSGHWLSVTYDPVSDSYDEEDIGHDWHE